MIDLDVTRLAMYFGAVIFSIFLLGKLWGVQHRLAYALGVMSGAWAVNSLLLALWLILSVGADVPRWVVMTRLFNAILQITCPLVVLYTLNQPDKARQ